MPVGSVHLQTAQCHQCLCPRGVVTTLAIDSDPFCLNFSRYASSVGVYVQAHVCKYFKGSDTRAYPACRFSCCVFSIYIMTGWAPRLSLTSLSLISTSSSRSVSLSAIGSHLQGFQSDRAMNVLTLALVSLCTGMRTKQASSCSFLLVCSSCHPKASL